MFRPYGVVIRALYDYNINNYWLRNVEYFLVYTYAVRASVKMYFNT
jgi:hypothetical protein